MRVTQGDVGPVCAGRQKIRKKNMMSKKAYLKAVKKRDIFKGDDHGQGQITEAELQFAEQKTQAQSP